MCVEDMVLRLATETIEGPSSCVGATILRLVLGGKRGRGLNETPHVYRKKALYTVDED